MSITILADENIPALEHYLGAVGTVRYCNGRTLSREQLHGVDALLVRSVSRVDEALLADSSVRFVGTATSGFDHIDREYLLQQGIAFAHAPGSNANSVVEYVLAAIAAVGQKLEQLLSGGTIGIVGHGAIGTAVAARMEALGIASRVYDPWLEQDSIPHAAALEEVLDCDVVSLHPELTREQPWPSVHLLGEAELSRLRPGSLLINASRGPVVDNTALLARLLTEKNLSVVLDVWEGEPDINNALLQRVTLGSAHIAGYSLDGKLRASRMLSEAMATQMQLPRPPAESPVAEAPVVAVPETSSSAALVRHLLQFRYDIRIDDALLRQAFTSGADGNGGGQSFDMLRKTYRERRELAGSRVSGTPRLPGQYALLTALGCTLDAQGARV